MIRLFTPAVLAMTVATAACVPEGPQPPMGPSNPDACGASALSGLVGQDRKVLETMKFGTNTRIIEPGMAVTMDYSESRLNISIDEAGKIDRVTCG
jgi:hypothetical protein